MITQTLINTSLRVKDVVLSERVTAREKETASHDPSLRGRNEVSTKQKTSSV